MGEGGGVKQMLLISSSCVSCGLHAKFEHLEGLEVVFLWWKKKEQDKFY